MKGLPPTSLQVTGPSAAEDGGFEPPSVNPTRFPSGLDGVPIHGSGRIRAGQLPTTDVTGRRRLLPKLLPLRAGRARRTLLSRTAAPRRNRTMGSASRWVGASGHADDRTVLGAAR